MAAVALYGAERFQSVRLHYASRALAVASSEQMMRLCMQGIVSVPRPGLVPQFIAQYEGLTTGIAGGK
jgi:hypothetical protein